MPKVKLKTLLSRQSRSSQKALNQKRKSAKDKNTPEETVWEMIDRICIENPIPMKDRRKILPDLAKNNAMAQAKLRTSLSKKSGKSCGTLNKKGNKRSQSRKKDEKTLWEAIADIRDRIPIKEWDKIPTDLAKNVDHYLYGHPKVK